MKILKLMLGCAIVFSLAACGESPSKPTEVKPEATTTTTTVHPTEEVKPAEDQAAPNS